MSQYQYQFLFSAVFGFRKLLLRIFSELHETKGHVPIFPAPSRSPKERRRRAPRCPNHTQAWVAPLPRHQVVWPLEPPPTLPLRLYIASDAKTLKYQVIFPEEFRSAAAIDDKFRGTEVSIPARCRDREVPPESSTSTPPPSSSPLLTPMMRRE